MNPKENNSAQENPAQVRKPRKNTGIPVSLSSLPKTPLFGEGNFWIRKTPSLEELDRGTQGA